METQHLEVTDWDLHVQQVTKHTCRAQERRRFRGVTQIGQAMQRRCEAVHNAHGHMGSQTSARHDYVMCLSSDHVGTLHGTCFTCQAPKPYRSCHPATPCMNNLLLDTVAVLFMVTLWEFMAIHSQLQSPLSLAPLVLCRRCRHVQISGMAIPTMQSAWNLRTLASKGYFVWQHRHTV